MRNYIAIAFIALSIQSCASTGAPGKMVPANTIQQKQMLESQRGDGYLIVGEHITPAAKQFLLTRPADRSTFLEVDGSKLIPKNVQVDFEFNSTEYRPTGEQQIAIRKLSVVADRVLISGNTVCRTCSDADRLIAAERARVAKIALIDAGMEADRITVSHDASDRHVIGGSKRFVNFNFIVDTF